MRTLKAILVQVSVICSFACIITKVLDWYNPYMDFSGHIWYVQICLYASVITLALLNQGGRSFPARLPSQLVNSPISPRF